MNKLKITPMAKTILDQPKNEYWRPRDGKSYKTLLVDAIHFGKDACRLAGPFNQFYGLVYVNQAKNPKPLALINSSLEKRIRESVLYYPYKIQKKIEDAFGNSSEFWWHDEKKISISNLDIRSGASIEGFKISDSMTSLFAHTEAGVKLLFSPLNDEDWREAESYLQGSIEAIFQENEHMAFCQERQYSVRVQGTDDTSYTKTVESMEAAEKLLLDLHEKGYQTIDEQMLFSN